MFKKEKKVPTSYYRENIEVKNDRYASNKQNHVDKKYRNQQATIKVSKHLKQKNMSLPRILNKVNLPKATALIMSRLEQGLQSR